MVKLTHDGMEGGKEFSLEHAYNVLNNPHNGGWKPLTKKDAKIMEDYQKQKDEPDHNGNKSNTEESEGEE